MNALILAATIAVSFAEGQWNPNDFQVVKCARFDYVNDFVQMKDRIANRCPEGVSAEDLFKKHMDKVYSVMLYKDKFKLGTTVSSRMGWDWRMAPIITIARDLGEDAKGRPELREHWEVCLYDEGINFWHHFVENGKQRWFKLGALQLPPGMTFAANKPHELKVKIAKDYKGNKFLEAKVEGYTLYCQDSSLPDEFYLGLNGCEGRNFFWDFKVEGK